MSLVDLQGRFPTPATIFEYWYGLVERLVDWYEGDSFKVEQKGLDNIVSNYPVIAGNLNKAFLSTKQTLENAVAELQGGDINGLSKVHFGDISLQDVEYLRSGFQGMLSDIEHIFRNQERVVLVSNTRSKAFVILGEVERKLYFDVDNYNKHSPEDLLHTVGHELTHLSDIFESRDFWYLSLELPWVMNKDKLDYWSKYMVCGENVPEKNFNPGGRGKLISKAGMSNINDAIQRFNESKDFRTRLALRNADTLMNFARSLSDARSARR